MYYIEPKLNLNIYMFFSLAAVEVGSHLMWHVSGLAIHGQVIIVTWIVIAIILGISIVGTGNLKLVPNGLQNFVEVVYSYVANIAKDQLGESHYRSWVPYVGTLFFIYLCSKLVRRYNSMETYKVVLG
jgi:F-type H+-transporting ATPase subunit a